MYDSLAPLNLPSKPLVYVSEKSESIENEQTKLQSILKSSMSKTLSETSMQTCRFLGMKAYTKTINPTQSIPPGYICMICRKPGHLKQFCPDAANLPKPEDRPKYPSGIPRTNLRPAQPGEKFAMLGPEGYVVPEIEKEASKIIKKEKLLFQNEDEEKKQDSNKPDTNNFIPKELKCPFGDHILKDAVLVPCCGHFICCDDCIRNRISNEESIDCPNESCDQEIDSFAGITPYHEMRRKCNEFIKSKNLINETRVKKLKEEKSVKIELAVNQPEIDQKHTRTIQHSLSASVIRDNIYNNQYLYHQGVYYDYFGNHHGFNQNYDHFEKYYDCDFYQHQNYSYGKFEGKCESENFDRTLEIMTEQEFNEYKEKLLNDVNNRREMDKREANEFKKHRHKSRSRSRSKKYKKKNRSRSRSRERERKKSRSYSRSVSRTRSKKAKKKSSRKKSFSQSRSNSRSPGPVRHKDENMGKSYRTNDFNKISDDRAKNTRKVLRSLSRSPSKYHYDKPRHKYK